MMVPTLGDLSQSYSMRQRNVALRTELARYSKELATGQVADVRQVLDGNYTYLTDIERKMDVLAGYAVATTEAGHFANGMQMVITEATDLARDLSSTLITAGTSALGAARPEIAREARTALDTLVDRINTNVSGRFLFSGTATDQPPLPDAQTLLDALSTAIAGAATPGDMIAATQAWFDDPAGYATTVYQGANDAMAPFALSETDRIGIDLRATDPEIKRILSLTAVAALADDAGFGLNAAEKADLFVTAGQSMLAARDGITSLGARVGFVEAHIESIATRNAVEQTSLSYAKAALLEVDPFEAATRLEDVQFNLQSLYAVTVRNAELSLVNFI